MQGHVAMSGDGIGTVIFVKEVLPIGAEVMILLPGEIAPVSRIQPPATIPEPVLDVASMMAALEPDAPVPQSVIDAAKRPPKLKSNPSTAPPRAAEAAANVQEFEWSTEGLTEEELREIRSGPIANMRPSHKPSGPLNPGFELVNRPISAFDRR